MNAVLAYNLTLDSCGAMVLLLFLMPQFNRYYARDVNRHRQRLLNDAAVIHLFVLLLCIAGSVGALVRDIPIAQDTYRVVAIALWVCSALLTLACICCDTAGVVRVPRGREIPVEQIACAALPLALAAVVQQFQPQLHFAGIAWAVALHLNHSFLLIDSEKHLAETERRLDRTGAAQMSLLIQPHFVFNTLSAIEALCLEDPQTAAECVENLSGYLRNNMDALSTETPIPFDTEMNHIRQYIALERADPSRQFKFDYELDERDFTLPALTVQPIVENAVKHGALTHRDGTGRVLLTTGILGSFICITVTDNGLDNSGLTEAQRESKGLGIESTRKRLRALCGGSLHISSDEHGTKAVILIPR